MGDVDVLESAYNLDRSDGDWLGAIAGAVTTMLGGVGGVGWFANAPDFHPHSLASFGAAESTVQVAQSIASRAPQLMGLVLKHRNGGLGTCSEDLAAFGFNILNETAPQQFAHPHGLKDFICVRAVCPSGLGLVVGTALREVRSVDEKTRARWSRVCSHLASALRLRTHLATRPLEAVLRPDGRIEHAIKQATSHSARQALRSAVRSIEALRTRARRNDPDVLAGWHGLIAGRWTLLDSFEENGRRYLVARPNEPDVPSPHALSVREGQIAAYAALGHSQKEIAYDMGLAPSTVQGHLKRALTKLGLRSSVELTRIFAPWRHQPR